VAIGSSTWNKINLDWYLLASEVAKSSAGKQLSDMLVANSMVLGGLNMNASLSNLIRRFDGVPPYASAVCNSSHGDRPSQIRVSMNFALGSFRRSTLQWDS
jgi:hypothetical protein